jgi:hypothetical protein
MAHHMSEDELLTAIVEGAMFLGWRVHHIRRSDKAQQMGNPGFPDVVLAKGKRIYFLELKDAKGQLTPDQLAWLQALPNAYLVRPAMLDQILSALAHQEPLTEAELGL